MKMSMSELRTSERFLHIDSLDEAQTHAPYVYVIN